MRDIIIIGAGPAGLSAAITARNRAKSVLVISQPSYTSGLYMAKRIDNYPGMPAVSGEEMLRVMTDQAKSMGVDFASGRVLAAVDTGDSFYVNFEQLVEQGKVLIIACGVSRTGKLKGEARLLGNGVSYCATCDGMFYRGKKVVVTGNKSDAAEEARFLKEIGCDVLFAAAKKPAMLDKNINFIRCGSFEILGRERVEAIRVGTGEIACDGVFVLNETVAPSDFMPGIETIGRYVKVTESGKTNIKGVYAAGDCTGEPLQIAKAVGQGQTAALCAAEYLDRLEKEKSENE